MFDFCLCKKHVILAHAQLIRNPHTLTVRLVTRPGNSCQAKQKQIVMMIHQLVNQLNN